MQAAGSAVWEVNNRGLKTEAFQGFSKICSTLHGGGRKMQQARGLSQQMEC